MRIAEALPLTPDERRQLEARAHARTAPARLVERARILLLLADGLGIRPAARHLNVGLNTLDGTVVAQTMPKHRAQEWLKLLKTVHRRVAKVIGLVGVKFLEASPGPPSTLSNPRYRVEQIPRVL